MLRFVLIFLATISASSQAIGQDAIVMEGQRLLTEKGLDPGPADGLMGPNTRAAIIEFQRRQNLPQTGTLDDITISELRSSSQLPVMIELEGDVSRKNDGSRDRGDVTPIDPPNQARPIEQKVDEPIAAQKKTAPEILKREPPLESLERNQSGNGSYFWWIVALVVGWLLFRIRRHSGTNDVSQNSAPHEEVEATVADSHGQWRREKWKKNTQYTDHWDSEPELPEMRWHGLGEQVEVAGYLIDGMVYTGRPNRYQSAPNCLINPSLRVAQSPYSLDYRAMPYWPKYQDIDPRARATYLSWLARGRRDPTTDVGYVFLFFYGLERRFFLDHPDTTECRAIVREVRSLLSVYGKNNSVQRYFGEFLDAAAFRVPGELKPIPVFDRRSWETPLLVRVVLGVYANSGKRVSADWMLSWLVTHPEQRLRTPAKRCFEEFKILFGIEFKKKFPKGYSVANTKRKLQFVYRAASGEFEQEVSEKISNLPDISTLSKPINDMEKIAEEATQRLEKYSRFLGRNPDGRGTLEAQALLPPELRKHFPSAELDQLQSWVDEVLRSGGIVTANRLVAQLEGEEPQKLSKAQLTGASDALARLGYGVAPDPRFALRTPKSEEPIIIFDLGDVVERLEDVSEAYRAALVEIALGAFIAHADGTIVESEKALLQDKAARTDAISDAERKRLFANIKWLMAVPPDFALLRRNLKEAGDSQRTTVRAAVVSMAHADNIIHPEEVERIEKVYATLGLDPGLAYSDLHAGVLGGEPVTVKAADPKMQGERIPAETSAKASSLDAERIAEIRGDTKRVSEVLGAIFSDEETQVRDASHENDEAAILDGLDSNHTELLIALIGRDQWDENEFASLAERHGLLSSGALETINEWSFMNYNDGLLEAYDGIDLSPEVAQAVRAELKRRGN